MNQCDMLACIMANDDLYQVMKEIYSKVDNMSSIKLILGSLRQIKEEALEGKKKELRKILNGKRKELDN